MTKFCSALYLENLLTSIFAKLNLRGGVSCMPEALLFTCQKQTFKLKRLLFLLANSNLVTTYFCIKVNALSLLSVVNEPGVTTYASMATIFEEHVSIFQSCS